MAVPFIGSVGKSVLIGIRDIEKKLHKTRGRIYGLYEGSRPTLIVTDPDVLRDIFVKDFQFFTNRRSFTCSDPVIDKMITNLEDEDWKRVRTLISPTFSTGKIKKMTSIFFESAEMLKENFEKAASEEKPVDVKQLFGAFTMDVIASSAFATKLDSHNNPENPFVSVAKTFFGRKFSWRIVLFVLYPGLAKLLCISPFPPGPIKFFTEVTRKIIEERKRNGQRRNDFLQMLMDAEHNLEEGLSEESVESSELSHEEGNKIYRSTVGFKTLSNDEMVAQCVAFFLAGYDTTASTLSCVAFELALSPCIQEMLIEEIDESITQKGELCYETIYDMKYLDCVISETLRKYPPAIRLERIAEVDYHIKRYDVKVPKGMIVGVPVHAIHRDPEYYPDPKKFDPERFSPEIKATRHPYTYLPFGAGPRNCVAMRFALMEVKVCIAYMLSQFRFHTCSETQIPLRYYVGQGIITPRKVVLKIEIRTDNVKL